MRSYGGEKSQDGKSFLKKFLRFLQKKDPYGKISKILFQKFSLRHRSTKSGATVLKVGSNLASGASEKNLPPPFA